MVVIRLTTCPVEEFEAREDIVVVATVTENAEDERLSERERESGESGREIIARGKDLVDATEEEVLGIVASSEPGFEG